jgi:uncharacterized protein YidB (DUF937 family)
MEPQQPAGMMEQALEMIKGEGLGGLVEKFKQSGLGEQVSSWVGKGENLPISVDQLKHVLSGEQVQAMAAKLGVSADEALAQLRTGLPALIDKLTPDGQVPDAASLIEKARGMLGGLLGGTSAATADTPAP